MATDMLVFPLTDKPLDWPCVQESLTWFNLKVCYPPAVGDMVLLRYIKRGEGTVRGRLAVRGHDNEYRCVVTGGVMRGTITHYAYLQGPEQQKIEWP